MDYQVRWTREQRDAAKAGGKALYAIGVTGPGLGRYEVTAITTLEKATLLLHFALALGNGSDPTKALEEAQACVARRFGKTEGEG